MKTKFGEFLLMLLMALVNVECDGPTFTFASFLAVENASKNSVVVAMVRFDETENERQEVFVEVVEPGRRVAVPSEHYASLTVGNNPPGPAGSCKFCGEIRIYDSEYQNVVYVITKEEIRQTELWTAEVSEKAYDGEYLSYKEKGGFAPLEWVKKFVERPMKDGAFVYWTRTLTDEMLAEWAKQNKGL
jgi:hypothetical protein